MDFAKLFRRIFIVTNIVFVLLAIGVFAFGAYLWATTSSTSVVFIPFVLFTGLFVGATGIFGLVGMFKKNVICLKIYICLVVVVLLLDVVIAVGGAIEKQRLFIGLGELWKEFNQDIKDHIQVTLNCCGYHGPSEYDGTIPDSCYKNQDSTIGYSNLNGDSCRRMITRWMDDNVAMWMIPEIIIILIELSLLFTACRLLRSSKQKSKIVDSHGLENRQLIKDMNKGNTFKYPAVGRRKLSVVSEKSNENYDNDDDYEDSRDLMKTVEEEEHVYSNADMDAVFGTINDGHVDDEQTALKSPMDVQKEYFRLFDTPMHTIGKKTPENRMRPPIDTSITPHPPPSKVNLFNVADYAYVKTLQRTMTPVEIAPPPLHLIYKDKKRPMKRTLSIPALQIATPRGGTASPIPSIYNTKEPSSTSMYSSLMSSSCSTPPPAFGYGTLGPPSRASHLSSHPSSSASTPPPPAFYEVIGAPPSATYISLDDSTSSSPPPPAFYDAGAPPRSTTYMSLDASTSSSPPPPAFYDIGAPPRSTTYMSLDDSTSSTPPPPERWATMSPKAVHKLHLLPPSEPAQAMPVHRTQSIPAPTMTDFLAANGIQPRTSTMLTPPPPPYTLAPPPPSAKKRKKRKRTKASRIAPAPPMPYDLPPPQASGTTPINPGDNTGTPPPAASYHQPTSIQLTASLDKWGDVNMADPQNIPEEILHAVRKGKFNVLGGSSEC